MFSIFYLWEHTQRVWFKNLWNWHVNDIWPFDLTPKVTSLTLGWIFYLHSVLLITLVDLICHMTMFENLTTWAPPAPQSPTPGAWPRLHNENPVWYVLYLSFVRTHTEFGMKIFEIDFVIEIKWYLIPPQGPRGRGQKTLRCAPHSCEQLTHQIWLNFVQWFRRR